MVRVADQVLLIPAAVIGLAVLTLLIVLALRFLNRWLRPDDDPD